MNSRGPEGGSGSVRRLAIADVLNDGPPYQQSSAPPRIPYDGSRWPYQGLPLLPHFSPGLIAPEIAQQRGLHHWAHSDQLYHPPTYVPRGLAPSQTNVMNSFNPESYMTHADRPQHFIDQYTTQPISRPELPLPTIHPNHQPGYPNVGLVVQDAQKSKKVTCSICLESSDETKGEIRKFPHNCPKCPTGKYCEECLKDWFLDATKNESKMPVKCCMIVPVASGKGLLTIDQVELYKAKFEEWSTHDRLYCPVPSCSTFITPRLYTEKKTAAELTISSQLLPEYEYPMNICSPTNSSSLKPSKITKPRVNCPKCGCSVCTECHSFTHFGKCPESDLDPGLEEQLKKWKIKRCPRCRTGVRKVYGCSHVACLCGAHFCFECMKPINQCDGGCEDESDDELPAPDELDEDDLDGRARYYEGDGHDFGPEPYGDMIAAWGCRHEWTETFTVLGAQPSALECNLCFRAVKAAETPPAPQDEDTPMSGMEVLWPTNTLGEPLWNCFMGHLACPKGCPEKTPERRIGDASRLWVCDCGLVCNMCDRTQAIEKFAQDLQHTKELKYNNDHKAWECRCGIVVCGACKDEWTPEFDDGEGGSLADD